eukprot:SRR837773.3699.p2 GENE.SRR837773.3699~~SRR837773.3699.p2  ORF type:complete len:486 (-),score=184.33 SRR837773.3699:17-1432(-)
MAEQKTEKQPLNDSSSGSDSDSDSVFGEVGFHIPQSEIVTQCYIKAVASGVVAAAAVAAWWTLPPAGTRVLDPMGCLAFGYIYAVFAFQCTFLEWPAVPARVLLLLLLALLAFVLPTLITMQLKRDMDLWMRAACWALDVAIILAGYYSMVRGPGPKHLAKGSLKNKVFVVTGCNTGIGYETARVLAEAGATVVFACRTESKARAAMQAILDGYDVEESQLVFVPLDVSSLASVRKFPGLLEKTGLRTHTLILNAGAMFSNREYSVDGLEQTMATNHFGHFLLVHLLLPSMLLDESRGEKPRIVVVGSNMSYMHDAFDFSELEVVADDDKEDRKAKPYELFRAYGQSKFANLHFTTELARRLKSQGSKIPVNQIHPGEVLTEVMRDMNPIVVKLNQIFRPVAMAFMKTPLQGAFCTLHVATDPSLDTADKVTGAHFVRCSPAPLSRAGRDEEISAQIWRISEEVTGAEGLV